MRRLLITNGSKLLPIIFLMLISMGAYWNTLSNDFVAGDRQFILRNQNLGDYKTVLQSFTSDYWGKLGGESFIYYRPIAILSHFIDFNLYGLNPAGHHFSNMVFHTIVVLLVYQLFSFLFYPNSLIPLVGAGLFALHPIHTHSVSYVMGRTDMLAALFYIWGLILFIANTHLKKAKIIGACCCYFLSLLCKEIAITLPLILVLHWFFWPSEQNPRKNCGFIFPFLALCVTLALYLLIRVLVVGISAQEGAILSWYSYWQRIGMVFITYGFYVWKLFFPLRLCYYSNLIVPGSWGEAFSSYFFWAGIFFGLSFLLSIKGSPWLSFALGWIGLTLLPVVNIMPIPTMAKENFLYIPSIGFCLLISIFIKNRWAEVKTYPRMYKKFLPIILILMCLLYTAVLIRRNSDYKDPITFLMSTLRNMTPVPPQEFENTSFFEGVKNFYVTYKNLGILYQEQRQWKKSAWAFENALRYTPSYFNPEYAAAVKLSLGKVYEKIGKFEEALQILLEARHIYSKQSTIDNLLGVVSIKLGQKEQAELYFKSAIEKDDTYALAHYNLGLLYMGIQKTHKGSEALREAARLNAHYKETLYRYGIPSDEGEDGDRND